MHISHLDPAYILQQALQEGSIPHCDDKFLIHGPGGVGKSSLIAMFLGTQRDLIRSSTPVASEPLHLKPIRDVSTSRFTAKWERVDYERLSHMIAHTSNELYLGKGNDVVKESEADKEGEVHEKGKGGKEVKVGEGKGNRGNTRGSNVDIIESDAAPSEKPSQPSIPQPPLLVVAPSKGLQSILSRFVSKVANFFKRSSKATEHDEMHESQLTEPSVAEIKPSDVEETELSESDETEQFQPQMSTEEVVPCLTATLEADPDNIQEHFSNFLQDLQDKVRNAKEKDEVLLSHSIRIVDSGGQPQFHELIAIFLAHISGFISVFKLNEALSAHGEVVLYNDGQPLNDPYESYYSHEQVIRHDLQAIQSEAIQSGMEEMPNLAFVGTFLDEEDKCSETPDMKDDRLQSIITEMLPPEMQECVITPGGSLKQVTFRINARTPGKRDFDTVDGLKRALLIHSRVKPRDLPLKWHGYEVALHMLMEELKRQSLSRNECEFIAHKLGFNLTSLNAALHYLRQLNIIAYYDVLPNIIFGSSQVILDKITELVYYSLELKKGQTALSGSQRKFVKQGIVSLQFLQSPALSKHYIRELFQPEDLLKVLISQLVVSAVGAKEFIMPCVLEVSSIYPSPPITEGNVRSSFILHFSKKSPMFGVYCCTISSLMTDAGWKLLTEGGEVVQVARNSFTFEVPMGLPGKLTFLDPISSYLEVILDLPAIVADKHKVTLYPTVRNAFFTAIMKAMETLHYDVQVPEVSYLCPDKSSRCSAIPHPATIDVSRSFLKCSLKPSSVCFPLTEEQKIWLPNTNSELLH